jgi:heptosyltransferase II
MHILVIMPRWVGDVVMATPMLRGLRRHFASRAKITGVLRPLAADLLAGSPWFDETILYDRRSPDMAIRFPAVTRQLRADRPDVAIIIPNSLSSAALALVGGARRRIGMAMHWRRWLLTDPVSPPRKNGRIEPFSSAAYPVQLAALIGMPPEPLRLELAISAEEESLGAAVLARLFPGHDPHGPLVVLNDGAAFGPAKRWGMAKVVALARLLVDHLPHARVLVHCGPADRDEARAVVEATDHPAVQSLAGESQLPFGLSKAVIRQAAVLVSTDSGPRHVAAAFQRPTVVLYGPMDPRLSRAEHEHLVGMRLDLPCSPCGQPVCPLEHHDCMRLLSVEDVGAKVLELLESTR